MEDLLVYGIIAVAVIVNIIKTFNKEKSKNKDMGVPQTAPPIFSESINSDDRKKEKRTKKNPVLLTSSIPQTITPINSLRSEEEEMAYGLEISEENTFADKGSLNDQMESDQKISFENRDELRKAIVYSIILEKKYNI